MAAELGKYYKTHGGWEAKVVWVATNNIACFVIHKPDTPQESVPIAHDRATGQSVSAMQIAAPPTYDQHHPADLILE